MFANSRSLPVVCVVFCFMVAGSYVKGAEAENIPDYGEAFGMFYDLGLADVENADYVKLQRAGQNWANMHSRLHQLQLNGNAWLLQENKDGPSKLLVNEARVINVYSPDKGNKGNRGMFFPGRSGRNKVRGKWQDVALKPDVKKTLSYVQKMQENPDQRRIQFRDGTSGKLLLKAAHFYRKGYKEKANRIADMLFEAASGKRKVVQNAINNIADAQYKMTFADFLRDHDWEDFHADVESLLSKFDNSWKKAGAVKKLVASQVGDLATRVHFRG